MHGTWLAYRASLTYLFACLPPSAPQLDDDTIAEDDEEDVSKSDAITRSLEKTRAQLIQDERRGLFTHKIDKGGSGGSGSSPSRGGA